MNNKTVLIIDDEPDIRELLEITISRMGLRVEAVGCVTDALQSLANMPIQLCLTDIKLPDGTGLDIVRHIQQHCPDTAVAVITAFGSTELAVEALKAGAFDFINKPLAVNQLRNLIKSALRLESSEASPVDSSRNTRLLGESDQIRRLREQIRKLARSQAPVYISGESGSGKEVVARLIHANGPRSNAPFVPVNCGAIPSELVESEFFGHVKGSFTGAYSDKEGLFEAANSGTLFLDEVADLPLSMQVKLLRAIQEKAIRRVGSNQEIPVDVRILSATHKDLTKEVAAEHFRSDLFYRINVIEVQVPSLRQRREDIPLLARFMLEKIAKEWDITALELSDEALQALNTYSFPGNVRELENIIERAATLCEGNTIRASDLSLPDSPDQDQLADTVNEQDHLAQALGDIEAYVSSIEKSIILKALEANQGNKTESARMLGITFRQFRYKLKKYEME